MANKEYSWHHEVYDKALKDIAQTAGNLCNDLNDLEYLGWLEWFAVNHPELYKKYDTALLVIVKLWGNKDPKAMEEFKAAVRVEVDATKWAVEKYLQWQRQQKEAEALKGTQESLV
jgi:hypothetical protein